MSAILAAAPKPKYVEELYAPLFAGQAYKGLTFWERGDKLSVKPAKVLEHPTQCKADASLIHLRTTRGNWCIHKLEVLYV